MVVVVEGRREERRSEGARETGRSGSEERGDFGVGGRKKVGY